MLRFVSRQSFINIAIRKDTDEIIEAEKRPNDLLVILHDDMDTGANTFVHQLYKRILPVITIKYSGLGYRVFPYRSGKTDVFMAYSKNSKWHLSVVVKVDFKVMCFFLLTIKCPS